MLLNTLHTLSGWILIISFITKICFHYYINQLGSKNSGGLLSILLFPLSYFKIYSLEVKPEHQLLKRICNFLLFLAAGALVMNIVCGILMI
jgi:hypothetical protein